MPAERLVIFSEREAVARAVVRETFHIIPRAAGDSIGYRWNAGKLDANDAEALVAAITAGM